jgi:hypothetical protein
VAQAAGRYLHQHATEVSKLFLWMWERLGFDQSILEREDHLSQLPPPRLLLRFPPQLDRRHGAPSTMKTNRIDLATATREQLVALCKRQRAEIQTLKEDLNYTRDDLISSRIAENRAGKFLSQFQDQLP